MKVSIFSSNNSFLYLVFALLISFSSITYAIPSSLAKQVDSLHDISKKIDSGKYNNQDLVDWTHLVINIKSDSNSCVVTKNTELDNVNIQLDGLGEKVAGESLDVANTRKELIDSQKEMRQSVAQCNSYILNSNATQLEIDIARSQFLESHFLKKQPNIIELSLAFLLNPDLFFDDSIDLIWENTELYEINKFELLIVGISMLLVFIISWKVKKVFSNIVVKKIWDDSFPNQLYRGFLTTSASVIFSLLSSLLLFVFFYYFTIDHPRALFVSEISLAVFICFFTLYFSRLLLDPVAPATQFMSFPEVMASQIFQRIKILLITLLLGYSAFYTSLSNYLSDDDLYLLRYIYSLFAVVNVVWIIQIISVSSRYPRLSLLARLVSFLLLFSLVIEWIGYVNMSNVLRANVLVSFVLLILFYTVSKSLGSVFDDLDGMQTDLAKKLRTKLAIEKGNKFPGMIWFRLLTVIGLWGSFIAILIATWDFNGGVLEQLKIYVVNGFSIGDMQIVPSKILWALIIFACFSAVAGWLKSQLENKWLLMTNLDAGARDAMATVVGYMLFITAVLIGLSTAGFDFANLAIVAGALSVGIGFGLQNIVNNFVSGLILLFERPVRKGDWIVVGGTEGFVQKIQIRSTLIRTFDNADVIVPNSELISNQVTNWMLSSKKGRAILPIGVAYGSDTELVKNILLEIAEKNEKILQSGQLVTQSMKPSVLFIEFGDSSLNFELRVFVKEINNRMGVISELNFAIDAAFKKANIKIPFPQRDVHVKT